MPSEVSMEKGGDLNSQKAKLLGDIEIFEPGHLHGMKVNNMTLERGRCEKSQQRGV